MEPSLGVFEFVVALVVITTIGKVVTEVVNTRRLPPGPSTDPREEIEELRESVSDLSSRVHTLEEERDFYRDLLEVPKEERRLPSRTSEEADR